MVRRRAVSQVDSQPGVVVDRVGEDRVPIDETDELDPDADDAGAVESDGIAGTARKSADRIIARAEIETVTPVAQVQRSLPIGADELALERIPRGTSRRVDAMAEIPG